MVQGRTATASFKENTSSDGRNCYNPDTEVLIRLVLCKTERLAYRIYRRRLLG
jgi:hypothetical protein